MKKLKNEQKEQQKGQTLDYGTNIDAINVKKSNVAINGVVLVEELSRVEIVDKTTSTERIKNLMEAMLKIEDEFNEAKEKLSKL